MQCGNFNQEKTLFSYVYFLETDRYVGQRKCENIVVISSLLMTRKKERLVAVE
jgi:hypothetical protein